MMTNPLEFLAAFLPSESRRLTRTGVQIHNLQYWSDSLGSWVGQKKRVQVHFDPRDITVVYVRAPSGALLAAKVTTPGILAISLAEWKAHRSHERSLSRAPVLVAMADQSQARAHALVEVAKASRKIVRRKATAAAGDRYRHEPAPTASGVKEEETPTAVSEETLPDVGTRRTYFDVEGCGDDD